MPWLTKRWISFFILSAALAVVLVSVTGWANNQEANKLRNQLNSYGTDPNGDFSAPDFGTNWTDFTDANQVLVSIATVNSFDPNSKTGPTFAVTLSYFPILNLTSVNPQAIAVPIQIIVQQKTSKFSANEVLPDQPLSLDAPGNPNNYPFDSYDASIFINASILPTNDDLPLTLFIIGDVEGFTYTTQFQSNDGGSPIEITFDIRRNTTSRIFAAIFFLLMWFLSLTTFVAAMSVWFRGKTTELGLVSISTGLLFALPKIRNSQPGVPSAVGTTEDMVGFFWNMLLVAISAISLLVKWVLQNKRSAPTAVQTVTDPEIVKKPLLSGQ